MDSVEKEERGRSRNRSIKLDKKHRNKRRSGSQQGKDKYLGNSCRVRCSYCLPSLSIRVYKTLELKKEMCMINKEFCQYLE
jgi:hypothetical protein